MSTSYRLGDLARVAISTVALLAAGCATRPTEPVVRTVRVDVPVATPVYCDAPPLAKPELPIRDLGKGSTPADTVRAYAASIVILKGAVQQRDDLLKGCAKP